MAPRDRGAQRLLARIGIPRTLEQIEGLSEAFENLARGQHSRARCGQLHCQWKIVEPAAEVCDCLVRLESGTCGKQLDRLCRCQRRHGVLHLAAHPQQLTTGDQHAEVDAGRKQRGELWRGFDHLFEVVEHEQHLTLADVLGKALLGAERQRNRLCYQLGVAQGCHVDPEHAIGEFRDQGGGALDRQSRLAAAARSRKRDKASAAPQ